MNDNDLIRLFRPILIDQLEEAGFTNVKVVQANQPTQQGAYNDPTLYFFKLYDKRLGFVGLYDTWDEDTEVMIHTEIQQYLTTFQIESIVRQLPTTPYQYTASDLVNEACAILQSDYAISTLLEQNVGILRVSDVRNPYFMDDRDQFSASSSFDFTLTHLQTRSSSEPVIETFNYEIERI